MTTTKFGLAQPVRRVEDPRLLKGAGRYTDDIVLPGCCSAWCCAARTRRRRSPGWILPRRRSCPGSSAVYTAADLAADGVGPLPCAALVNNRDGSPQAAPPHPVLAEGAVRHVGDPVAFIVAESIKQARDAAEMIEVDYDILPSITELSAAMDKGGDVGLAGGASTIWRSTGRLATRQRQRRSSPRPRM